jgi:hypothetical protein
MTRAANVAQTGLYVLQAQKLPSETKTSRQYLGSAYLLRFPLFAAFQVRFVSLLLVRFLLSSALGTDRDDSNIIVHFSRVLLDQAMLY